MDPKHSVIKGLPCIHFYEEFDEKSCIKAKIESRKCLHAIFLLTVERHYWHHKSPTSNQINEYHGIYWRQLPIMWYRVTRCSYWIVKYIVSH